MSIKDFANDLLDFAKNEASKENIAYLKSEVKDMIENLEAWKVRENTTVETK